MSSGPGPIAEMIGELTSRAGLVDSDFAAIVNAPPAAIALWKSGAVLPPPAKQLVLSGLHFIVRRLTPYYAEHEIKVWLFTGHAQLGGERSIDLISRKRSEAVLVAVNRLDMDVYL
jgi:hypothetical protein